MRRKMRSIKAPLIMIIILARYLPSLAMAQIAGTEGITSVFSVGSRVAGYDISRRSLRFFSPLGNSLREEHTVTVDGNVTAVTLIPTGYAVASGMGRENPNYPARITIFTGIDSTGRVVFE